jgi:hypothetical protein
MNEDHCNNLVLRERGAHDLTADEFDTPFVSLSARMIVDPVDPEDVAAVNRLKDGLAVDEASEAPYTHPDHDAASLDAPREPLLRPSQSLPDASRTFGSRAEVDPVRHLIGTAYGWGGLPEREAFYLVKSAPSPVGHHRIPFRAVPVDAFWSLTIDNRDGFLEANECDSHSLNSVTATADDDGTVTIDLAPAKDGYANHLYLMDGWNYAIRRYRPRPRILDGTWTGPVPERIE